MIFVASNLLISLIAMIFERMFGYSDMLYKAIRHPVVWMGGLITLFDKTLNRKRFSEETRKMNGAIALLLLVFVTLVITGLIAGLLRSFTGGILIEAFLASSMLAQKSLRDYVRDVGKALGNSLEAGRQAVGHIVGRDPKELSESDVSKAAVESLAENTADGVIAPLFWMVLFGLPGAAVYKAINTADSMIGHKNAKYKSFGWASARLDDVVNYPASRLTGLLFVLAAFTGRQWNGKAAYEAMHRDARHHVSPNAGWSEAAMAGALSLTLGGPRSYNGRQVNLATMGQGRSDLNRDDIQTALKLYARSITIGLIMLALVAILSLLLV